MYVQCMAVFIIEVLIQWQSLLQDGKLVGAMTHVLVSDPEVGYGIFIENMLEAA